MSKEQSMEDLLKYAAEIVERAEADRKINPKTETIQVVIVEPFRKPYTKTIKNELKAMNEIVDGYIEIIPMGYTDTGTNLIITLNEEGKLRGMTPNRFIMGSRGGDLIVGPFFVSASNMEGDNVSLTDTQAEKIIKQFSAEEVFI